LQQGIAATTEQVGRLVEAQLGPAGLQAYLVDNAADARLLRTILEREYSRGAQPKVVISRFLPTRHNVPAVRTAAAHPRLMDLLQVDNAIVFNYLVDQHSVEAILVCPSQDAALAVTARPADVPAGMRAAITHDFNRFFPATRGGGGLRTYWIQDLSGAARLFSTADQRLHTQQKEIDAR
jgi:hypothetical protein